MQRLGRMQKHTVNAHAVHRRLQLAAYLATLAHSTDHQFPAPVDCVHELRDCARKILCSQVVGAIEVFQVSESVALGGYDMEGRGEGFPIAGSVGVGEGHGVLVLGLGFRVCIGYRDTSPDEEETKEMKKEKSEGPICIDSLIINQEGLVSIPPR